MATKERKPLGRGASLQQALSKIQKDRDLRIGSLSELGDEVDSISTGNISIDAITGVGGLPRGRLIELYGLPSSGKTTTALQTAANAQRLGETVLYLDYENALDVAYCKALGLDPFSETFLFTQPETFESGMTAMRELIETGEIGVAVVDSVASMAIEKELAIDTGESTFADKAKLMAQAMRQLTPIAHKHGTCLIFLNHIQEVIGAPGGIKASTTPGGRALKFHSSVRIEYKPVGNKRNKRYDPLTGQKEDVVTETAVKVTVTKNKVAAPFRSTLVRVRYGKGFSQAWSVYDILKAHGLIKKSGSSYSFDSSILRPGETETKVVGEDNLVTALEEDSAWLAVCLKKAQEVIGELVEEVPSTEDPDEEVDPLDE